MQTTSIEQEILTTVHNLPLELQQQVLRFSLSLKDNCKTQSTKISLPVFHGDGLQDNITLNNSVQLLDIMNNDRMS
jgi:hypothetical protein